MKIEIKQFPDSQEVMGDDEWFFIQSEPYDVLGSSCYGRIIEEEVEVKEEKKPFHDKGGVLW